MLITMPTANISNLEDVADWTKTAIFFLHYFLNNEVAGFGVKS